MFYQCCVCSTPVLRARAMFCKTCRQAYRDEPWAIEMKRIEQARRDADRNHPQTLSLSSLSEEEIDHSLKVA